MRLWVLLGVIATACAWFDLTPQHPLEGMVLSEELSPRFIHRSHGPTDKESAKEEEERKALEAAKNANKEVKDKDSSSVDLKATDDYKEPEDPAAPKKVQQEEKKEAEEAGGNLYEKVKGEIHQSTEILKDHITKGIDTVRERVETMADALSTQVATAESSLKSQANEHHNEAMYATGVVDEKVSQNIEYTDDLSRIVIRDKIQEKKRRLAELKREIERLSEEIPPPKSVCEYYVDCGGCVTNPQCGWCSLQGKCVEGDNIGPLYEICAFYDYKICSGNNCFRYKDCHSCLGDPFCGWCDDAERGTKQCLERDENYEGCPKRGWFHPRGLQPRCGVPVYPSRDPLQGTQQARDWEVATHGPKPKTNAQLLKERQDFLKGKAPNANQKEVIRKQEELRQKKQEEDELMKELWNLEKKYSQITSRLEKRQSGETISFQPTPIVKPKEKSEPEAAPKESPAQAPEGEAPKEDEEKPKESDSAGETEEAKPESTEESKPEGEAESKPEGETSSESEAKPPERWRKNHTGTVTPVPGRPETVKYKPVEKVKPVQKDKTPDPGKQTSQPRAPDSGSGFVKPKKEDRTKDVPANVKQPAKTETQDKGKPPHKEKKPEKNLPSGFTEGREKEKNEKLKNGKDKEKAKEKAKVKEKEKEKEKMKEKENKKEKEKVKEKEKNPSNPRRRRRIKKRRKK
eukprot:TRINITY_DN3976_c0_g1_i6.p1 TRINITY_DN3976_c0_g1~~TRINITY_DN3976_c0_g1_i6.p1  ORF type:complete len:688 (-),score=238.56 TRINITY_DN3976_c0_g1_i6:543-2606(-)